MRCNVYKIRRGFYQGRILEVKWMFVVVPSEDALVLQPSESKTLVLAMIDAPSHAAMHEVQRRVRPRSRYGFFPSFLPSQRQRHRLRSSNMQNELGIAP